MNELKNLVTILSKYVQAQVKLGGLYYLCTSIPTRAVPPLLPLICEHSERVFIGKDYKRLFCEHGEIMYSSSIHEAF